MSMRDYGVDDYGIVVTSEKLKELVEDGEVGEYVGEFTGDATKVDKDGMIDYRDGISYSDDVLHYIPILKYGSLFEAPYKNMAELVTDMKSTYGEYFPEDFDYANNIRHISGTYFG